MAEPIKAKKLSVPLAFALTLALALGLTVALPWLLDSGPPVAQAQGPDGYDTYHVALSCTGVPTPCFTTVQAAVDAADDPDDVIKVATGTYTGVQGRSAPAGYNGPSVIIQVVYVSKTVTIRGGYTTAFTDPPDPVANPTTLDAQQQGRALFITGDISPAVEGLRITGGDAAGLRGSGWGDAGGGVYVTTATAIISDSRIFSNTALYGGGLYLDNSAATLSGNVIANNTAEYGGGLSMVLCDAILDENNIVANVASNGNGGGVSLRWSNATFRGNTVIANAAGGSGPTGRGGGLFTEYGAPTLISNTFAANRASVGGGLAMSHLDILFSGNTVISNTAHSGGGLHLYECPATLSGNVIAANTALEGGGLSLNGAGSNATLNGNTIISNSVVSFGGGLSLLYSAEVVGINNVIADNQAGDMGSGLYIKWGSFARLLHTTIAQNTGGDGSGVYVESGTAALTNTILVSHTVGVYVESGSAVRLETTLWGTDTWANTTDWAGAGTIITGATNVWDDPSFVNPDERDYHVTLASAAVDRGVALEYPLDMDGDYRPVVAPPDLGADEILTTPPECQARLNGGGPVYPSLQEAIVASTSISDVVEVAGVCEDSAPWNESIYAAVLTKTLTVRGGYCLDSYIWNPLACPTVLNGHLQGGVLGIGAGASPAVEYLTLLGGQTIEGGGLWSTGDGATMRHLRVVHNLAERGGGVYLGSGGGLLEASRIEDNRAFQGGGVYLEGADTSVAHNNTIQGNTASVGGGLYLSYSATTVNGNTVADNYGELYGGGLHLYESAASLDGNIISANATRVRGGGMCLCRRSDATLVNNIIVDNWASVIGSGLYIVGSSPRLMHNTIARNIGSGVHVIKYPDDTGFMNPSPAETYYSAVVLTNTILAAHATGIQVEASNTATLEATLWGTGTWANDTDWAGPGTINIGTPTHNYWDDPAFVDPDAGNYHIGPGSAAIDAGVDAGVTTDVDGEPRPVGPRPDLGADEYASNCFARLNDGAIYPTVQATVDASTHPTDVIKVAGYCTGVNDYGGLAQVVYISKTVTIQGGYTTTNWTTPHPITQPTTLDAQGQGRVLYIRGNISPTIEGLRITGGDATGLGGGVCIISATATISNNRIFSNVVNDYYYGGGLYLLDSDATLEGNTISGNTGGGLYLDHSIAKLNGNTITFNTGGDGGGIFLWQSDAILVSNTISSNTATHGGGICLRDDSSATIISNTFSNNTAIGGGGVCIDNGNVTFTGNTVTSNTASVEGGGLLIWGPGDFQLNGNTFTANSADYYGGGLCLYGDHATLTDNTVTENTANYGGGLILFYGSAMISDNIIISNIANYYGGGLLIDGDSDATFLGNTVNGNTSYGDGGGMLLNGDVTLSDNIISFNTAHNTGGGVYLLSDAKATWTNNIVADNQANAAGSGLYIRGSSLRLLHNTIARNTGGDGSGVYITDVGPDYSTVAMTNSILVSHTVGIYVDSGSTVTLEATLWGTDTWANTTDWAGAGTIITGAGNLWDDPAFVDPDAGNYHIGPGSAAIDAGVNTSVTTDVDGDSRPIGPGPDLGADEYAGTCFARLNDGAIYRTVQAAVDASTHPTDVVKVAGYCTGVNDYGGLAQVVYVSKTVTIRGGYTTTNWTTPHPITQPTTLDAEGQGRVLYITGNISPTIEGLRITGGNATGLGGQWMYDAGGGIYVVTATAIINNNQVFFNTAQVGGGLHFHLSNATLGNNTITFNTAQAGYGAGGGLSLYQSNAMLTSNTVSTNTSSSLGGGLRLSVSEATLIHNVISNNSTGWRGGGLFAMDSSAILISNTIAYNSSLDQGAPAQQGGGMYLGQGGGYIRDEIFIGNTFIGNLAEYIGGGLCIESFYGPSIVKNNAFISNTASNGYGGGLHLNSHGIVAGNIFLNNTADLGGGLHLRGRITLTNNIIADNQATYYGSGLAIEGASSLNLLHNTIARNTGGDGSGIHVTDIYGPTYNSTVALINTILVSHTVGVHVSDGNTVTLEATLWGTDTWANTTDWAGAGTIITGTVNVWDDPAFVDPYAGDYHIGPGSAAIDAGVDAGITTDVDGDSRPIGHGYDIGADELYYPALEVTKQARPHPVQAGERLTYTIRVTNTGNVTLSATITDFLPARITPGETPSGTLILPNEIITWTPVIIVPGDVWSYTFAVTVEVGYAGPLTNVVEVTTEEGATGFYVHTLAPDLDVFKQAHSDVAQAGEQLTYTIHVTNTGNFDLHATITDTLPEHVTTTQPLVWASQLITAPGGVWTETVVVTVEMGYAGPLTNVVEVTTEEGATGVYTHVVPPPPTLGVEFAPDHAGNADPGTVITYAHTLTNTGNVPDVFTLEVASSEGWPVALLSGTYPSGTLLLPLPLDTGATATLQVSLTVPADAISGTVDTSVITATSQTSAAVQAAVTDTTTVNRILGVEFAPDRTRNANPGTTITCTHALTNSGNGSDIFDLTHHSSQNWPATYDTPVSVGRHQTATVVVSVTVPAGAISGTVDTTVITATSRASATVQAAVTDTTTVNHLPGVAIGPDHTSLTNPDTIITYTHILANVGNGYDTFHLTHKSSQGWSVAHATLVSAGYSQTATVIVSVTVPPGSSGLTDTTILTATSQADAGAYATVADVTTVNVAPIADAGPDQSVAPGATVLLDGSASADPDGHLPLAYRWQQSRGPLVVLVDADKAQATFQAPPYQSALTFTLSVTDTLGLGGSPDAVVIYVEAEDEYPVYLPLVLRQQP